MTDQELVARCLAGDRSAERALYDARVDRVFRLAYRLAGDADLAQDFTQETFIRAFADQPRSPFTSSSDRRHDNRTATSYSACVHAVIPNPRVRYRALNASPARVRNTNESSRSGSPSGPM